MNVFKFAQLFGMNKQQLTIAAVQVLAHGTNIPNRAVAIAIGLTQD